MSTFLLKRIFLLICVSCLSTAALADVVNWTGGGDPNTPYWGIAANWDLRVPLAGDSAVIKVSGAAVEIPADESYEIKDCKIGSSAECSLYIAPGATLTPAGVTHVGGTQNDYIGTLEVDGTVNATGKINLSTQNGVEGTIIVNEGGLITAPKFQFGDWSPPGIGRVIMNGGLIDIGRFEAWLSQTTVIVDLNDGVYRSGDLNSSIPALYENETGSLSVDIDNGTWIINGDETVNVATMKNRGEITAFGGIGTINCDYNVSNSGKTTVTATHPLNPSPEHKGIALTSTGATLEWDNYVEPNEVGGTVTADVWFGTLEAGATEPNKLGPNYNKVAGWDGQVVTPSTRSSTAPQALVADTTYYWQVDFDNGSGSLIEGPVFEFLAVSNDQPQVTVKSVITWLDQVTGEAVVVMDANVVDDTPVEELTYTWTLEPAGDPNVVFDSTAIKEPTLTINSIGTRTLTLTVNDGYWDEPASAEVRVYGDPCWAARVSPGYTDNPAGNITGNPCLVDLVDFAALAQDWLDDTSLTEYLYY